MYSTDIDQLAKRSQELINKWNTLYSHEISVYFKEQLEVLEGIRSNYIEFKALNAKNRNSETGLNVHGFHAKNIDLLNTIYTQLKTKKDLKDFISKCKLVLLDDLQHEENKVVCEYSLNAQGGVVLEDRNLLLKNIGDFFYWLRCFPQKQKNVIARLFKKPVKPIASRYHTVYFRDIVVGFFVDRYVDFMLDCTFNIQQNLVQYAYSLFEFETKFIDSNYEIGEDLFAFETAPNINDLIHGVDGFYSNNADVFQNLMRKSGTWELPLVYISIKRSQSMKKIFRSIENTYQLWDSTFYAFYEDWRFREELFCFIASIQVQLKKTLNAYSSKLNQTIIPVISNKREYLDQLIQRIPNVDEVDVPSLKHFFSSELYTLQKEIRTQSLEDDFKKTYNEIVKVLQKIEFDILSLLSKMPERSGVVRSPNYEKGIRKNDIYYFSPIEFIEFECVPAFLKSINAIMEHFKVNFEAIVFEFSDFDQITDFTLDTAVSMLNAENSNEQIILTFKEGMSRLLNILERVNELGAETLNDKETDLSDAYFLFIDKIKQLDDNDSILKLYSRLIKSKAIQESKNKRIRLKNFLVASIERFSSYFEANFVSTVNLYKDIRKKLKLDKAPVFVSSEISNYLADINKRIYQIPVIYRYLFENVPVKEVNLFLSRQLELDKISNALNDWKVGNYAATLVVAEKGAGKSSLLQYYLKTLKGSYKISHLSVKRSYSRVSEFYELIQDIFENKELIDDKSIQEFLNQETRQRIVVLDGMEHLFLRKPGGFECMHKLLSFLVASNNQIFWLCAISLHASNYLNKTIALKENFDYLINLNNLTSDEIRNIVLKRHRLSGYVVHFKVDQKQEEDDRKQRERQMQLESEFFNELNKFADSNISLSLYYWLESISEFTDKEVIIKRFKTPDFSFLESLSSDKIFTLLLIVLHGRISVELHAEISNQNIIKSGKILTIMKEDSILIQKGDYYILNGILYRNVVQLLKNKNLIH